MSKLRNMMWCLGGVIVCLGACQTGGERREDDDIVGKPPSVREDPFAYAALPAPTQRVETTGMIEVEPVPVEPTKEPADVAVVTVPPKEVATRVAPATPVDPIEPSTPDAPHCFSCVRICAQSDPTEDCSQSVEDMICGWGTAEDELMAGRLAQAQCDAVLDMARQMSRWRTIEGSCPAAACR